MRTHLDKICQIGLFKTASIWEVLACSLHRDLQTWYNRWVGLLAITRACVIPYLRPKPINLYFKKCITKPYQMGHPPFYLSVVITTLLRSRVIALNNLIRYSHCWVVQLFGKKSLLKKAVITIRATTNEGNRTIAPFLEQFQKHE